MDIFPGGRITEVITFRLDRGEDVLDSIQAVVKERDLHTGVVLSGIGTLDRVRMHFITHTEYPPNNEFVEYEGPYELLSIQGLIADYLPHLHTCVSIKERTYMGHLEPGCRVLYLAEIVIGRMEGVKLTRDLNPETGIRQLRAEG
jgi:predicted DNA-binding protein with PD1-like motif